MVVLVKLLISSEKLNGFSFTVVLFFFRIVYISSAVSRKGYVSLWLVTESTIPNVFYAFEKLFR